MTESSAEKSGGPVRPHAWRIRAKRTAEERLRIVNSLFPERSDVAHWWFRFALLMFLSVVIATMGMSLDSSAVVIGAMLIAPLMTPVLAISAALVMAWPGRLALASAAVIGGTVGAVASSWIVTSLLPGSERILTAEVLSRTSPDLRSLIVALAAGAAGAYATMRDDVSIALPGVAVAVALVPPLAAMGFALSIGRASLAGGALLLYTVNLVAIVLAGAAVMLASGFVPPGRLRSVPHRIRIGLGVAVAAVIALAIPLTVASIRNSAQVQVTQSVNQVVVDWLKPYPDLQLIAVNVRNTSVTADVSGSVPPPSSKSLARALESVLGPDAAAQVRWFQTAAATSSPTQSTIALSAVTVRPVVDEWLASSPDGPVKPSVLEITIDTDSVAIHLVATSAPPSAQSLATSLSQVAGRPITVSVNATIAP